MTKEELLRLLKLGEWNDIEFKEARNAVPRAAFETVSAFANTHGGWLVFGVAQHGEEFEICGVDKPDKVQGDFLSVLHADQKVNHDVEVTEQRFSINGQIVLDFQIGENVRHRKPVYLDGDIRRTFLRKGGSNYKARMQDIERLMRDATEDRWDSQPFHRVNVEEAVDTGSLRWYRDRFSQHNEGFDPEQSEEEFLHHWGYLVRDGETLLPTRAAIMLFGSPLAVHQLLPRPTLDVQFLPYATDEEMPKTRWIDRFVSEENIIRTWQNLIAKYKFFMPKPFRDIDPVTLERRDAPPGFRVFREAAMNLLIHQDYGDHSRKATIKFFRDGIQFWNPGDVFGDDSHLLDPGEKEVRNPGIVSGMRRIIMCEQAGTGLRMMRQEWQGLGHPAPVIVNDRTRKAFEFFVPGLDAEVDMASNLLKAMFGKEQKETIQVRDQVGTKSGLSQNQMNVICNLMEDKGITDLMLVLRRSSRTKFRDQVLNPLIKAGLIEMTIPDKPRSSLQKYRLTAKGRALLTEIEGEHGE